MLINAGQHEEAARQLDDVPQNVDWDTRVEALKHAITFARAGGSESDLTARVASNPNDLEARLALAAAEPSLVSESRRKLASVLN